MSDVPAFSPWPPLGSAADLARRFGAAAPGDTCASAPATWPTIERFEVSQSPAPVYVWAFEVTFELGPMLAPLMGVPS